MPIAVRDRRGITLLELMVTLAVGGVALALIAGISVRQQRVVTNLSARVWVDGQLADAAAILPIELRSASSVAGDLVDATDTSLLLRATIASAIVCDAGAQGIILSPGRGEAPSRASDSAQAAYSSFLTPVAAGDTAWVLAPSESSETWSPYRVAAVGAEPPGPCASLGPRLGDADRAAPRAALLLDSLSPAASSTLVGLPLRVTRPERYSLYRASDDRWYLGLRGWNTANLRFNTIQPVSGPFLGSGQGGLVFRYADAAGAFVDPAVSGTRGVAMVRIELRASASGVPLPGLAAGRGAMSADSVALWVLLRNRR